MMIFYSYIKYMFEWDETKRKRNLEKHGVDFETVWDMDWARALRLADSRLEYGEERYIALGFISGRLHVCVYTLRGADYRIISLRKANKREEKLYAQTFQH